MIQSVKNVGSDFGHVYDSAICYSSPIIGRNLKYNLDIVCDSLPSDLFFKLLIFIRNYIILTYNRTSNYSCQVARIQ